VFTDLSYFGWLIRNDILQENNQFQKRLAFQAQEIAMQVQHIRPPRKQRDDFDFALIVDRNGVFKEFLLTEKNEEPVFWHLGESKISRVAPTLDVTMAYTYRDEKLSVERMCACLRRVFLDCYDDEPDPVDCEAFFNNRQNFNGYTAVLEALGITNSRK
jgi:hypothetical protein